MSDPSASVAAVQNGASCEHHWISTHQPDFPTGVYWIRQCDLCQRFDGADLTAQVVAAADAAVQAATPGIQAGALRGAAEWIEHHDAKAATNVKSVRKWLRTNADRIEADHE